MEIPKIKTIRLFSGWKRSSWSYSNIEFARITYAKFYVQGCQCMGTTIPMLCLRYIKFKIYWICTYTPIAGWNCIHCLGKYKMIWCFPSFKGTYRDESAPLLVGTSLALSALAAVCAYGGWRYANWPNLTHNYPFI